MAKLITEDELFVQIRNYNSATTATAVGSMSEGMPLKLIAEVVDVEDDMQQCRIKAHIHGFTKTDDTELSVDDLPWCYADAIMQGMYDAPVVGDYVWLDMTRGIYNMTWMHLDMRSEIVRNLFADENAKAKVVVYDDAARYGGEGEFGIWWTPQQGWNITYNGSVINIRQDKSIYLKVNSEEHGCIHMTADGKLSFGTENTSAEPATLGNQNNTAHQNVLDYLKEVVDNTKKVMDMLAKASQGNPYTMPLVPGFQSFATTVQSPSNSKHKECSDFLPDTLSDVSTLD